MAKKKLKYGFKCHCGDQRLYKTKEARDRCVEIHIETHKKRERITWKDATPEDILRIEQENFS